jgi:hypothetical protein
MIYTNPLYGIIRTLFLFLTGRIRFGRPEVGATITMDDGQSFKIFRRVVIKRYLNIDKKPEALFIVRFTPKMDIKRNIKLSKIMLLIFMGFKGFRSKYWCVDEETGVCQGVYEWDTLNDAERYSRSIAVKNMTKRSIPGSVSFKVLPNCEVNRNWRIADAGEEEKHQFRVRYHLA